MNHQPGQQAHEVRALGGHQNLDSLTEIRNRVLAARRAPAVRSVSAER